MRPIIEAGPVFSYVRRVLHEAQRGVSLVKPIIEAGPLTFLVRDEVLDTTYYNGSDPDRALIIADNKGFVKGEARDTAIEVYQAGVCIAVWEQERDTLDYQLYARPNATDYNKVGVPRRPELWPSDPRTYWIEVGEWAMAQASGQRVEACSGRYVDFQGAYHACTPTEGCRLVGCPAHDGIDREQR